MRLLAIDPGSTESAWLRLNDGQVASSAKVANDELLEALRDRRLTGSVDVVVVEWTAPRGMPASQELFETLWWAGRFAEAAYPVPVDRINRLEVKRRLLGTTASKDSNVRAALIDRFGGIGGKAVAIGTKAAPGPLHGIGSDVWAALAVAVTYEDGAP